MSEAMTYAASIKSEGNTNAIFSGYELLGEQRVNQYSSQFVFSDGSIFRFNNARDNFKVIESGEVVYEHDLLSGITIQNTDYRQTQVDHLPTRRTPADKIADAVLYIALALLYAAAGYFAMSMAIMIYVIHYAIGG